MEKVFSEFENHAARLKERSRARRDAVRVRNVVFADEEGSAGVSAKDLLGKMLATDEYRGDANMRTLNTLLTMVDGLGFERSRHQLIFHEAFKKAVARVIYKEDWGSSKPLIMRKYGWTRCASEVLISTPRRFGKTFSCDSLARPLARPRSSRGSFTGSPSSRAASR